MKRVKVVHIIITVFKLYHLFSKFNYCFQKIARDKANNNDWNSGVYYNVKVFYRFNLPILGEIATFTINGRTGTFVGSNTDLGEE